MILHSLKIRKLKKYNWIFRVFCVFCPLYQYHISLVEKQYMLIIKLKKHLGRNQKVGKKSQKSPVIYPQNVNILVYVFPGSYGYVFLAPSQRD